MRKGFLILLLSVIMSSNVFVSPTFAQENNDYVDNTFSSESSEKENIAVTYSNLQGWDFGESTGDTTHQFTEQGLVVSGVNTTDKAVGRVFLNAEEGIGISDIGEIGIKFADSSSYNLPGINLTIAIPDKVPYCNLVFEPWLKGSENSWWATRDLPDFKTKLSTFTLREFQEQFPETIVYQLGYNVNNPNGATIESITAGNKTFNFGIPKYTAVTDIALFQGLATDNIIVANHEGYGVLGIELNGTALNKADYIYTANNIALTKAYINTLPPGTHHFTVVMNADDTKIFTITVQPSPDDNNNNGGDNDNNNPGTGEINEDIIVNTSEENGSKITNVIVQPSAVTNLLTSTGQTISLNLSNEKDSSKITVNLQLNTITELDDSDAMFEIITSLASYRFHPKDFNMSSVYDQLGEMAEISNGNISISISESPNQTQQTVQQLSNREGFSILTYPVEFKVIGSYEDISVEINNFTAFVERKMSIPGEVNPGNFITCITLEPSGQIRHIPTKIVQEDGVNYAIVNSVANSAYVLVENNRTFNDISGSYAKNTIENLASKFIVNGLGNGDFNPIGETTRAQFLVMLLNAFGIQISSSQNHFTDVNASDWYYGVVNTAFEHGIANGYQDGKFKPNEYISREEAIALVIRTCKYALINTNISLAEIEGQLAGFADSDKINEWAKPQMALGIKNGFVVGYDNKLNPRGKINRADASNLINSTLVRLGLI